VAAETDSGFNIEGRHYPVPDMGTFTMDEAQTLWDYSGLGLEDFSVPEDESEEEHEVRMRRYRNPGFLRALMHIAYQRGNPEVRATRVRALISNANVIAAFEGLLGVEEDDADPPAMTSAPGQSLPSGSDDLNGNSGPALVPVSDAPDETPENIGTTK
jgi:hypothetical protein